MSDTALEVAEADGRDFVTQEDVDKLSETSSRPEWLPEKYNSGEDLAKAYKELESKLGSREEDIRNKLIEEIQSEAFSDRPEKAGDYQLPDIVDEDMAVDNELLQWWSNHAFENGYSQDEFAKGIEMYAQAVNGAMPDIEAEVAKLGDSAQDRIEAASLWANNFFPEETLPAIERLCETSEGIVALEVIMEKMKDGSFAGDTQPTAGLSEPQLREMMADPRYSGYNKDADFVKQVDEGWQQLYRN